MDVVWECRNIWWKSEPRRHDLTSSRWGVRYFGVILTGIGVEMSWLYLRCLPITASSSLTVWCETVLPKVNQSGVRLLPRPMRSLTCFVAKKYVFALNSTENLDVLLSFLKDSVWLELRLTTVLIITDRCACLPNETACIIIQSHLLVIMHWICLETPFLLTTESCQFGLNQDRCPIIFWLRFLRKKQSHHYSVILAYMNILNAILRSRSQNAL